MQLARLVLLGIGIACLAPARVEAVSIGSASFVALDGDTRNNVTTGDSAASLSVLHARTAAASGFGSSQVALAAGLGHEAFAASLWCDSFTLTGGVGSADLSFHLDLEGVLAAEASTGGFARVVLRAVAGLDPVDPLDDTELGPNVVLAASDLLLRSNLGAVTNTLRLDATVPYDSPFTFLVTLEAMVENGAWVHFADTAHLTHVDLPSGATLTAASGYDYGFGSFALSSMTAVPEPGTLALLASGMALLALRRKA